MSNKPITQAEFDKLSPEEKATYKPVRGLNRAARRAAARKKK